VCDHVGRPVVQAREELEAVERQLLGLDPELVLPEVDRMRRMRGYMRGFMRARRRACREGWASGPSAPAARARGLGSAAPGRSARRGRHLELAHRRALNARDRSGRHIRGRVDLQRRARSVSARGARGPRTGDEEGHSRPYLARGVRERAAAGATSVGSNPNRGCEQHVFVQTSGNVILSLARCWSSRLWAQGLGLALHVVLAQVSASRRSWPQLFSGSVRGAHRPWSSKRKTEKARWSFPRGRCARAPCGSGNVATGSAPSLE